jgi:hypothetical protein
MNEEQQEALEKETEESFLIQQQAHEEFFERIRTEDPKQSCDMVRAWMKLNIESVMVPVWNN